MSCEPVESSRGSRRRAGGREWILFGGCDYLGLGSDPGVLAAAGAALGASALSPGGSRATSGTHVEHLRLEEELAGFLGVEAAALAGDGMLANLAALEALAREVDVALLDDAAHASLSRAARAAGMPLAGTPHLDVEAAAARAREHARAALLVDGYFPMRGELAPIVEYQRALPPKAWLVVDDAHGLGVVGARGRGSAEAADLTDPHLVLTGTLSKALGSWGGFVAGTAQLVAAVRRSEAYVCTTPIPAHLAAAGRAALALLAAGRPLERLRANLTRLDELLAAAGLAIRTGGLPVLALELPDAARREAVQAALERRGLLVPRVEYPGQGPHLRLSIRADHDEVELELLSAALGEGLADRAPRA